MDGWNMTGSSVVAVMLVCIGSDDNDWVVVGRSGEGRQQPWHATTTMTTSDDDDHPRLQQIWMTTMTLTKQRL